MARRSRSHPKTSPGEVTGDVGIAGDPFALSILLRASLLRDEVQQDIDRLQSMIPPVKPGELANLTDPRVMALRNAEGIVLITHCVEDLVLSRAWPRPPPIRRGLLTRLRAAIIAAFRELFQ